MVAIRTAYTANSGMTVAPDAPLPDDVETLKALLLAEREKHRAREQVQALEIERLKQTIAKLRHMRFGQSAERRVLGQRSCQALGQHLENPIARAVPECVIDLLETIHVEVQQRQCMTAAQAARDPVVGGGGDGIHAIQ